MRLFFFSNSGRVFIERGANILFVLGRKVPLFGDREDLDGS